MRPVSSRHSNALASAGSEYVGEHLVPGARRLAVDHDGHPHRVAVIAPDRRVDDPVRVGQMTPHHRAIDTCHVALRERVRPASGRRGGCGRRPSGRRCRCRGDGRCRADAARRSPAISGYRASSPLTSVPSGLPAPGMHDEAGRLVDDDHVLVVVDDRELDGRIGGRQLRSSAASSRRRRCAGRAAGAACRTMSTAPSTCTPPAATSAAASERLASVTKATTRSSRSPASAGGISSWIMRRASGDGRSIGPQHEQHAADVDRHVGDVEDREPLEVDEVDHRAVQRAVAAEEAVDEVAERAAGDQAGGDARDATGQHATRPCQPHDHHEHGDDADERADALRLRERHAAVAREVPLQRPDDVTRRAARELRQRPPLGELVDARARADDRRSQQRECAVRCCDDGSTSGVSACGVETHLGLRVVGHRRPIPPTFSSTSIVAHGMASRRSRGIGRPDSVE